MDSANDSEATFKSDDLTGATILASKHHVMGLYFVCKVVHVLDCRLWKDLVLLKHIAYSPLTGAHLTSGQKVTAVILHVDILSARVHVSILPKLLGKKKSVSVTHFYVYGLVCALV